MTQTQFDGVDEQPTTTTVATWAEVPNFVDSDGDIISSWGHLNAFGNAINYLLGLYRAHRLPFTSYIWKGGWFQRGWRHDDPTEYYTIYIGQIRHKKDVFAWAVNVTPDTVRNVQVRITVGGLTDDETWTGGGGNETKTGTIDVSSLTVGQFYEVFVEARRLDGSTPQSQVGSAIVRPVYLRETDAQSYTTPATFTTGTTPTAANWQLLSTQAALLYEQLTGPRVPVVSYYANLDDETDTVVWNGTITHINRYLYYDIRMRSPTSDGDITAEIEVNGVSVWSDSLDEGDRFHTPDPFEPDPEINWWRFAGTVDLNSLGLTEGNDYTIQVLGTHDGSNYEMFADIHVLMLAEQMESAPTLSGWTKPPVWTRGTIVTGTSSAKVLRDNLVYLTGRVEYHNSAVHRQMFGSSPVWMCRYHRWLHVRWEPKDPDDDPAPSIGYYNNGWQIEDLDVKPNEWTAIDLDSIAGLWPGSLYRVWDAHYALEDNNA